MSIEKQCTVLIHYDKGQPPAEKDLKHELENGDVATKVMALKKVILLHLNGEPMPQLLMPIIRYVVPVDDHAIKKIVLIYFEVIDRKGPDGKLLPEMILIGNALLKDLEHANEYVRGNACRFLLKLKEPELLEPLMPALRKNTEHRHSFVRRNAVNAVYHVYRNFEHLIPDAPELVDNVLANESDLSAKRNAFLMLFNCATDRAIEYLTGSLDTVSNMGDGFQLVVLELIRKVCRQNPHEKSRYMKCLVSLMNSQSSAVVYECAGTLISLSNAPTALKTAATSYTSLITKESDNNVKLIVLDRLLELKDKHARVLQDNVMDIMRGLNSPNLDVRKKTLAIGLDLIGPRNIDEVVMLLKKELTRSQEKGQDKNSEYRSVLIQSLHSCATKFPEVSNMVVGGLIDFVGEANSSCAVDAILCIREIAEMYPKLRSAVVEKLLEMFSEIKTSRVFRIALWILGEYASSYDECQNALSTIQEAVGQLPLAAITVEDENATPQASPRPGNEATTKNVVLADGTYATQTLESSGTNGNAVSSSPASPLRSILLAGDFYLGSVLSSCATKLALKISVEKNVNSQKANLVSAEVMLLMTAILRLGESNQVTSKIDTDSVERVVHCFQVLTDPNDDFRKVWLEDCRKSYSEMIAEKEREREEAENAKTNEVVACQPDDLINIRQLRNQRLMTGDIDEGEDSLNLATGEANDDDDFSKRLARVTQLTGFSDPVYAEAVVTVHQFDILLDILVVNRSNDPLQNLCVELATVGDLKLCERPQTYSLGPRESRRIKANIKVSSTETGIIFGNIVYENANNPNDHNCVILNDIHIDIMDYIAPASCSDIAFRTMWAEFEWENKVAVNTSITSVTEFLAHIVRTTNMKSLTPIPENCDFLSANLHARSSFGEDALANLSIEKNKDGKIVGYIRIRSKTQGIALSLGDKITLKQKG